MVEYHLTTPVSEEEARKLRVSDRVYLSGVIYTARDMAHIRMMECLKKGEKLPFNLEGAAIFHAGPIVRKTNKKWKIIAIGPTASIRMEPFEADIIRYFHPRCIIGGVGGMGNKTLEALKNYGVVFLTAYGGCSALNVASIKETLGVYWLDLGMPEAVWVIKVKKLGPLIVSMDSYGQNLYGQIVEKAERILLKMLSEMTKSASS